MPSESPTRMTSTPASSSRRAIVKSYAVTTAIDGPCVLRSRISGTVTLRTGPPLGRFVGPYMLPPGRGRRITGPRLRQSLGARVGLRKQAALLPLGLRLLWRGRGGRLGGGRFRRGGRGTRRGLRSGCARRGGTLGRRHRSHG